LEKKLGDSNLKAEKAASLEIRIENLQKKNKNIESSIEMFDKETKKWKKKCQDAEAKIADYETGKLQTVGAT
jgi:predicted  nucleic acid-binding Zn-ribbon protein